MKRFVASILILGLSVGSLYGCGSAEENAGEDETEILADDTLPELEEEAPEAVADTTAPEVTWTSDVLFTNSLSGKAAADILTYSDESDCTVELTRFTKLSNLEVLDDSTIQSYIDTLNKSGTDELLARSKNKAAGEGVYSAVVSVTDAAGNATAREILVIYDKTAPLTAGLEDRTIVQEDVSSEPQVDLSGVTITDNVDGEMSVGQMQMEIEVEDEATHTYTLHVSVRDRAGNEAIDYCKLTVASAAEKQKEEEAAKAKTEEQQKSAAAQSQAPATQSSTPAKQQTSASKPVQYETTTTTFNMAEGTEFNDAMAKEVLTILNQRRAEQGLAALTWDNNLATVAKVRSVEIVSSFSHTRPDGRNFYTALDDARINYGWGGENLACGQTSASVAMSEWMASQSHKDNILRSDFKKVGIACYYDPGTTYKYYWVQIFSD